MPLKKNFLLNICFQKQRKNEDVESESTECWRLIEMCVFFFLPTGMKENSVEVNLMVAACLSGAME